MGEHASDLALLEPTLLQHQARRVCALDGTRYLLLTRPGPRLGQAALALADCLNGMAAAPSASASAAASGALR